MKFCMQAPVAVARSSSGGVAIHYVLPVLWMTSPLAAVGGMMLPERLLAASYVHDLGGV